MNSIKLEEAQTDRMPSFLRGNSEEKNAGLCEDKEDAKRELGNADLHPYSRLCAFQVCPLNDRNLSISLKLFSCFGGAPIRAMAAVA